MELSAPWQLTDGDKVGGSPGWTRRLELIGLLALTLLAAGLRLWHLWDIPSPTDELLGVTRGLAIARGEIRPLTDFEPYIGAFWNYLLALGFLLFGPNEYVGRAAAWLIGSLTVPAAYLLGRELSGRLAGWIGAGLLATSSAHILATSHPAWSHCFSPLFATLGCWQLLRGLRRRDGRDLLACGLWLGLALQTHLTMLALLPGAGAYFLLKGRDWLKTPWPYLAGVLALLLITNILVFNLQTGFRSVRRAAVVQDAYARTKGSGPELYLGNIQRLSVALPRTLSGAIDIRDRPEDFLRDPRVLAPNLLALGGLLVLAWRRNPLPILVSGSYLGLLVVFNAKYEMVPNGRFLTPLAPLAFCCIGALAARLVAGVGRQRVWLGAAKLPPNWDNRAAVRIFVGVFILYGQLLAGLITWIFF